MCACEPVSGRPALCWPVGHRSISAPPKATAHLGPVGARSLALSLSRAGSICRGFQVAHVRPRCHLCAGRACKSMVTLMNGLSRWGGRAGRPTSKREREREREREAFGRGRACELRPCGYPPGPRPLAWSPSATRGVRECSLLWPPACAGPITSERASREAWRRRGRKRGGEEEAEEEKEKSLGRRASRELGRRERVGRIWA